MQGRLQQIGRSLATLTFFAAACGDPPVAIKDPTWLDVKPILDARCNHCHGREAAKLGRSVRLDYFPVDGCTDFPKQQLLSPASAAGDPKIIEPIGDSGVIRMPPPPAPPLEEWERQTLRRWSDDSAPAGERDDNGKPRIRVVGKLPSEAGDTAKVTLELSDPDGDAVIWRVQFGATVGEVRIGNGRWTIDVPADAMAAAGDEMTLSATICDGWEQLEVDSLGKVKKR